MIPATPETITIRIDGIYAYARFGDIEVGGFADTTPQQFCDAINRHLAAHASR